MAKYEFLFRMVAKVEEIRDTHGNVLEDDIVLKTEHRTMKTDMAFDGFDLEGDYHDEYMTMDFANDDAAIEWAFAFNRLHLDPWRVDWIYGPNGEDVFTR